MNQKLYYRILAFGLCGYIIYTLINFLFFKNIIRENFNIAQFKFLFPLFIRPKPTDATAFKKEIDMLTSKQADTTGKFSAKKYDEDNKLH